MAFMDIICTLQDKITPFQAALVTCVVLFYLAYLFLKDNSLPPGPIGLPYFGYYPFLKAETCHLQLQDMAHKYGNVCSFRSFGRLFIHLGSIDAIREAHVTKGDCFAGRFTDYNILTVLFQDGVAFLNGEKWKVLRRFFLQKFKEFGLSGVQKNTSNAIEDALRETIEELHNSNGQPIVMMHLFSDKCLSIVRSILFNDQGITMEEMIELKNEYLVVMGSLTSDTFILFGNFVKYVLFPLKPQMRKTKRSQLRIDSILKDVVKRHEQTYDGSKVEDVVDSFLKEREERKKKGDPTAEYFTNNSLANSLSQFVTDGVLTLGLFIGVFLLRLVEFPEEQQKIYEEIMEVVGAERLPTIEDRNKLPYTNAFIYEVMRLSDFFPFFASLECSKETEVQGLMIPKGAITVLNLYAAHRDPDTFDDPETFNPSRYLSSSEKKADLPILFGVGKRSCIGEAFTMTQTFLFLSTIVKTFRLEVPEQERGASITFFNPEKVKICAIPRSSQ